MDWDLDDPWYDPWNEWAPDPRVTERTRAMCAVLGKHEDRPWAERDEELYLAALLYAGAEPEIKALATHLDHTRWVDRVATVLLLKFKDEWWYKRLTGGNGSGDPRYRWKVSALKDACLRREHKLFYAWLCKQRKEQWTDRLVPY